MILYVLIFSISFNFYLKLIMAAVSKHFSFEYHNCLIKAKSLLGAITADPTSIRFFYIIQISRRTMRTFSKYFNMKVCDIIRNSLETNSTWYLLKVFLLAFTVCTFAYILINIINAFFCQTHHFDDFVLLYLLNGVYFLLYFNFMCHFHTEILCHRLLKEKKQNKRWRVSREYRLVYRLQTSVQTVETKLKSHWITRWVTSKVKIEL